MSVASISRSRRFKWVWHGDMRLFQVGILADGTLWKPNAYPDEIVRAAVLKAIERAHARKSAASRKAAATRKWHRKAKVHVTARRILVGQGIGPRDHCYICGRALDDPQSTARGIGSECWESVLKRISIAGGGRAVTAHRERLINRRASLTFELELGGLRYTATVSQFPDGRVAEVFLQNHKPGSQSDANARDSAIAASLALQYGCPLEVLRRALLRGEAAPQPP
jgi:Family of unknown function (DUF6011)